MVEEKTIEELQREVPEMTLEELKLWAHSVHAREEQLRQYARNRLDPHKEMEEHSRSDWRTRIGFDDLSSPDELASQLVKERDDVTSKLKDRGLREGQIQDAFEGRKRRKNSMIDSIAQYKEGLKK